MKIQILSLVLMFIVLDTEAQEYVMTFTGTGASEQIDSIQATNLSSGESIIFPGDKELVLSLDSGIDVESGFPRNIQVYPNPFGSEAVVSISQSQSRNIRIRIANTSGQIISEYHGLCDPGIQRFLIRLRDPGLYYISLSAGKDLFTEKFVCTEGNRGNDIQPLGSSTGRGYGVSASRMKSFDTTYRLGYVPGDVILYRCRGGEFISVLTDTPQGSFDYEVEFFECLDEDGRMYPTLSTGGLVWMAENLAFLPKVDASSTGSVSTTCLYVNGYEGQDPAIAKTVGNYREYGALYNWQAAIIACPSRWHLPSDAEWEQLASTGDPASGGRLKEAGILHWIEPNAGATNATGFSARPGGSRIPAGGFSPTGTNGMFWSSTDSGTDNGSGWRLHSDDDTIAVADEAKSAGLSVRCVRNTDEAGKLIQVSTHTANAITSHTAAVGGNVFQLTSEPVSVKGVCWATHENPTTDDNKIDLGSGPGIFSGILQDLEGKVTYHIRAYAVCSGSTTFGKDLAFTTLEGGTFTDPRDSRDYHYVKIGNQTWMAENLAFLPAVSKPATNSVSVAHCYVYGYDGESTTNARSHANYSTYGVLYNWPAALTACPDGWHLPGNAEFQILINFAGSDTIAGYKLKSVSGWNDNNGQNGNGDNALGFTALPGGDMEPPGYFLNLGDYGSFWTADPGEGINSLLWLLDNLNRGAFSHSYPKNIGFSVRCIKN